MFYPGDFQLPHITNSQESFMSLEPMVSLGESSKSTKVLAAPAVNCRSECKGQVSILRNSSIIYQPVLQDVTEHQRGRERCLDF